jgi:glutathione synthase/RimK-type ligase-like ATP-grasp enzyme
MSAGRLAQALGGRVLKREGSQYVPRLGDTIINWGASQCPEPDIVKVLNRPCRVATAANKLKAFGLLQEAGVSVPKFATNVSDVSWKGDTVIRWKLTGHSGEGIEITDSPKEGAPLYVQYIKKQDEYRVHIIGGEVVLIQRKARRRNVPESEVNWQVRNHANGFVFARNEGKAPPNCITDQAKKALLALSLEFGAVDVIYNENANQAYVLEVNCAPGLEGSTINDYAQGFRHFLSKES